MKVKTADGILARDVLEWHVPEEVLAVLLKDRSTGRNLIWATDDYTALGKGFGANDEMQIEQIADKDHPVIRPRVDKNAEEQRQRSVERAEVFTPSWICNKQNNLVDAAWFGWKKRDSSPFNTEIAKFDSEAEFGWKSTCGKHIKFPKGKTWQEYVKAPRLEVSCGEAPYLASRYDTVSGRIIPVGERIGLLDRKLRVITENIGMGDIQDWLYYAKRAVQSIYGFDWQGDNVLLARENVLFTVVESFNADFFGEESSGLNWTTKSLLEFAEIISWNIWQMDGIKYVVPMSCKPKVTKETLLDGTVETHVEECPGCSKKGNRQHFGTYCKVMDWNVGEPIEFRAIAENGGGHGK
ncbi:MAG: restriction endonuclease subunit M [Lentisphaerae bacterium]|nr:restriction endonuclease subunit M [Lentisphaerota bacterium]